MHIYTCTYGVVVDHHREAPVHCDMRVGQTYKLYICIQVYIGVENVCVSKRQHKLFSAMTHMYMYIHIAVYIHKSLLVYIIIYSIICIHTCSGLLLPLSPEITNIPIYTINKINVSYALYIKYSCIYTGA